jgi:hypothetical protein
MDISLRTLTEVISVNFRTYNYYYIIALRKYFLSAIFLIIAITRRMSYVLEYVLPYNG